MGFQCHIRMYHGAEGVNPWSMDRSFMVCEMAITPPVPLSYGLKECVCI